MTDYKENFKAHLHRFMDDLWNMSILVPDLRFSNPSERKFLLDKLEDTLDRLKDQISKLRNYNEE